MQDILLFIQHHWQLSSALVVVLVILILLEFIKQKSGASRLSPAQAIRLMNHENAVVLDLRSHEAFNNSHIVNAQNIPFAELATQIKKLEKFKNQPIILVCTQGADSQRAANTLMKQGFTTYLLQGGLRAWQMAELPLIKG